MSKISPKRVFPTTILAHASIFLLVPGAQPYIPTYTVQEKNSASYIDWYDSLAIGGTGLFEYSQKFVWVVISGLGSQKGNWPDNGTSVDRTGCIRGFTEYGEMQEESL